MWRLGGAGGYFRVLPILELQQLGRTWLQSAMGPESSPRFGAGRRPSSDPDLTLARGCETHKLSSLSCQTYQQMGKFAKCYLAPHVLQDMYYVAHRGNKGLYGETYDNVCMKPVSKCCFYFTVLTLNVADIEFS